MPVEQNVSVTKLTHPFSFVCDKQYCTWSTGHKTEADAFVTQDSHGCPHLGKHSGFLDIIDEKGQRYTALQMGKSILEKMWDELDSSLDNLMTSPTAGDFDKGLCSGIARSIQMMSAHYYSSLEAVTLEAVKRRSIRLGELDWVPTPGYEYNPPPIGTEAYTAAQKKMISNGPGGKKAAPKKAPAPRPALVVKSLGEEVDAKLMKALATGLFAPEDIAISFKVPIEYVSNLQKLS